MSSNACQHRSVARALPSLLASFVLIAALAAEARSQPAVEIQSTESSLVGEPMSVRVTGLPPDTETVLFSQLVDSYGRLWVSESTFRSDAQGVVDPAKQAPIEAAWQGVDALGPFWSPLRKAKIGAHSEPAEGRAERMAISAIVEGRAIATASAMRWRRSPSVEEHPVDQSLAGRMFVERGEDQRPAIAVLPGSGGGVPAGIAELLSSYGYASLALGYFGEPQTVDELERVPLEYFDRALAWLKDHPRVDSDRIALFGGSKGGELALLLGSRMPDIHAVVAAVPSSVVFQSIAEGWPRTSSWSVSGEELAFVPYVVTERFRNSGRLDYLYEDSLLNEPTVEAARIPVERISGPILLVSGRDDRIWPATSMCEDIVVRLREADFPHDVKHLAYENVGHEVMASGYRPTSWSPNVGGTRQGQATAQADAWTRMIAFLDEHLGSTN